MKSIKMKTFYNPTRETPLGNIVHEDWDSKPSSIISFLETEKLFDVVMQCNNFES
jgi:hypothetical protein